MRKPAQADLAGRHALVTGGGTGTGRSISLALARCGGTVIVNYLHSADAAEDTVAQSSCPD
jgi:3-oxoacyl-[acyl-carrier protein] reductase